MKQGLALANTIRGLYARTGGTWKEADLYVRVGGSWKMIVPPNAVIPYDDLRADGAAISSIHRIGTYCDGGGGTPNLLGRYPAPGTSANVLSLTPDETGHTGESHGACSPPDMSGLMVYAANGYWGAYKHVWNYSQGLSHSHTVPSHSHGGTAANALSGLWSYRLRPYMYGDYLDEGAVIFGDSSTPLNALMEPKPYGAYLSFWVDSAQTEPGAPANYFGFHTHNHSYSTAAYSGITGYNPILWNAIAPKTSVTLCVDNHYHRIDHYMPSAPNGARSIDVRCSLVTGKMYFSDLPSGSIVMFTSARVPGGWTILSDPGGAPAVLREYGKSGSWSLCSSSGSHNHSGSIASQGNSHNYAEGPAPLAETSEVGLYEHSHSWTDSHASTYDIKPPAVRLIFARKD